MKIELPPDGKPSALLRVKEWGPLEDGESELSRFMADMGLLGERPGGEIKSDSFCKIIRNAAKFWTSNLNR